MMGGKDLPKSLITEFNHRYIQFSCRELIDHRRSIHMAAPSISKMTLKTNSYNKGNKGNTMVNIVVS